MPYERAAGGYMAARKASKKVINFFVVGLTYGCRKSCNLCIAHSYRNGNCHNNNTGQNILWKIFLIIFTNGSCKLYAHIIASFYYIIFYYTANKMIVQFF